MITNGVCVEWRVSSNTVFVVLGLKEVSNASVDFIKRFRELGGEIITVGSDAHDASRVGQHISGALEIAKEVFGYTCTFEKRKVVFHKL